MTDTELKELVASLAVAQRETDQKMQEIDRRMQETDLLIKKLLESNKGFNANIGFAKSNEEFADEYFVNLLMEKMEFAGLNFNSAITGIRRINGSGLEEHFDIIMANDKAVALIEIKYKADKEDVEELVTRKMKNFKILFPSYKDFKIYLGLGSLSFNDFVRAEAKKYGIGLLKQVGETIEYKTDWEVRAY